MARMKREEWQDLLRQLDWTLTYADDEAVFPEWISGTGKVPREAWSAWEEDYKITYPEYVATQREKETGAYAVKAALQRSQAFDNLAEGWKSNAKAHFGAVVAVEYAAVIAESRMARFGLTSAWRNMAVFGALDEMRHTQICLYFAHEFVSKDPQYDWAQKAFHTNDWAIIAARALFDGMMLAPNVVDVAIQLPLTFETGFTNLQFVGLASDALASGDINFANMISSIQTDEARHSQQGGPTLEILMKHDPVRAQWTIDKTFWISARLFSILTGPAMDYYTPLEHRKQSYKEFMEEWIIDQFIRTLQDYGLKKPWYWDEFMEGLDIWQHSLHMGVWFWRPTVWWKPVAGVSPEERDWLNEKYPETWEKLYGPIWDTIIDNVNRGLIAEKTLPETLPWLCNLCQLPICTFSKSMSGKWRVRDYPLENNGYTYHFCSKACRQIWWEDRDTMHMPTVVERLLGGVIQPPDVPGILGWMGLTPDVFGDDGDAYRWAEPYKSRLTAPAS
ncbi:MAG TPA: toluene monooxygenase [Acidimicrobiales bacterium]|jgi:toluene monooxygenase system protein A|nr:toluene monooxygenase [Acidimicrobiales bacterium]